MLGRRVKTGVPRNEERFRSDVLRGKLLFNSIPDGTFVCGGCRIHVCQGVDLVIDLVYLVEVIP